MLIEFIKATLLIPITLFPILNPLSVIPVFSNLVGTTSVSMERRLARQIAINCWCLLLGAILIGSYVLSMFGVSLSIVRIGGGIIVSIVGWRLLGSDTQDASIPKHVANHYDDDMSDEELKARSFYPISFPLTVGPGTMAVSIALGANNSTGILDWTMSVTSIALGAGITALGIYFCYRYANSITRFLGSLGTIVFLRLSAFMLLCIGLQIIWSGVLGLLKDSGLMN